MGETNAECVEAAAPGPVKTRAPPISPDLLEGPVKSYQTHFSEFCKSEYTFFIPLHILIFY